MLESIQALPAKPSRELTTVIYSLTSFPPEIVHQILNDLPLSKILLLATYEVGYINGCILTHLRLRNIFPSLTHLSSACSYFKLYNDIFYRRCQPHLVNAKASQTLKQTSATADVVLTHDYLIYQLHSSISSALRKADHRVPLLASFSPTPLPRIWECSTFSSLQLRWIALNHAHRALNSIKSSQLRRLADIMKAHPNMLKKAMDPSQERRQNAAHIIDSLHRKAEHIAHSHFMTNNAFARQSFNTLPLVPYDRYLRLFLKVIKRYPPREICLAEHPEPTVPINAEGTPAGCGGAERKELAVPNGTANDTSPDIQPLSDPLADGGDLLSHRESQGSFQQRSKFSFCPASRSTHYAYPAVILQSIIKAIDGMAYVYDSNPDSLSTIIRTKYTPYSAPVHRPASGLQQPMFAAPTLEDVRRKFEPKPLCERELEWLTAFLDTCKFMSDMEDASWNSGETVAQMWKRYAD